MTSRCKLDGYFQLLRRRASGKNSGYGYKAIMWYLWCCDVGDLVTRAQWIRQFVMEHPDYKHDAKLPDSTHYDLMRAMSLLSAAGGDTNGTLATHKSQSAKDDYFSSRANAAIKDIFGSP